jgi:hypothetical protein
MVEHEEFANREDGPAIVLTVHKCSHQDHAGQDMHTEGGPSTYYILGPVTAWQQLEKNRNTA